MKFFQISTLDSLIRRFYNISFSNFMMFASFMMSVRATTYSHFTFLSEGSVTELAINNLPENDQLDTRYALPSLLNSIVNHLSECAGELLSNITDGENYQYKEMYYPYLKHIGCFTDEIDLCKATERVECYAYISQNIGEAFKSNLTSCLEDLIHAAYSDLAITAAQQEEDDFNYRKKVGIIIGTISGILICYYAIACSAFAQHNKKYRKTETQEYILTDSQNDDEVIEMEESNQRDDDDINDLDQQVSQKLSNSP